MKYRDKIIIINDIDKNKTNVIYKIIFPNGKIYIGQTTQKLRKRIYEHIRDSFSDKRSGYNNYKSKAIRKYSKIEIEVLYQGKCLDTMEKIFIHKYKSMNKKYGYNLQFGGHKNTKLTKEHKKKISEGVKGKNAKPVIVTEIINDKEYFFKSITEAANFFEIIPDNITNVLMGYVKTFKKKKYTVRYAN